MRIILVIVFIVLSIDSPVLASVTDIINQTSPSKISVIAFINNDILKDQKSMEFINSVFSQKFRGQAITIADDGKQKSPEFMEFWEQVQSDPINEKGIYYINSKQLADYGKNTGSDYTVFISITKNIFTNGNILKLTLIDVKTQKSLIENAWYAPSPHDFFGNTALKDLIKKFKDDFYLFPTDDIAAKANMEPTNKKNVAVVLFLPIELLERTELIEQIKLTIRNKFKVDDIPIYLDEKPKSQPFLNFIDSVKSDSAKQKAFLLKKEHVIQYGKDIGSSIVIPIIISVRKADYTTYFQLREDITAIDIDSEKYLSNNVFELDKELRRKEGVDILMKKLIDEPNLPSN